MQLVNTALSTLINLFLLAGIPFLCYWCWHKLRHHRSFAEVRERAGLRWGEPRFIAYAAALSLVIVLTLVVWPPALEPITRQGSAQHDFVGLGFSVTSVLMAILYGVFKTGFPEELLFRGLIAGSLSRRLPFLWANSIQALLFLAPHLLLLKIVPEAWSMMPFIFVGAWLTGWLRIRSGSIVGPWLMHATANVVTCLSVAMRS
ncbi:MAG: CPBP family intramembrane metalloprotease [Thermoanaerobaculia bacterium]|nr:CPBP family intramembrane metalloprotease [Thermoanaerobaculia bacterium]